MGQDDDVTAQVPDFVLVDGVEYALAGVSGERLFDPSEHGIEPRAMSSACWRGYVCWYELAAEQLLLSRLVVGGGTKQRGRVLAEGDELLGEPVQAATGSFWRGCWEVAALAKPMPFAGGLLLGADFVTSTYVHMGHHPAWKYRQVIEVLVTDGKVTEVADRSSEMAELRERITSGDLADPDGPRGGIAWVERTFTLDYSRSRP
jgi:hypothetical protein